MSIEGLHTSPTVLNSHLSKKLNIDETKTYFKNLRLYDLHGDE